MAMSKALTLAEVQAADAALETLKWIDVPALKGGLYVRLLGPGEIDRYEDLTYGSDEDGNPKSLEGARARFVALTVCDETGRPLFTEDQVAGFRGGPWVNQVFLAAKKWNGFTRDKLEDEAKNSSAGQPSSSPTGSP